METTHTWILISDGAVGRILLHTGPGGLLRAVPGLSFPAAFDFPRRSDRGSATPPQDADRFVAAVARTLDDYLVQKAFGGLILVAPEPAMVRLRAAMSDRLKRTIQAEIVLDLTKIPNTEVANYLRDKLCA